MKPGIYRHLALMIAVTGALEACSGEDGADGNSCSVQDNGDGSATISCTDGSSFTVSNGTDGAAGTDGTDGTDGEDGTDCTVTDNDDGTKTIECGDVSVTVTDGTDGKSCTVTENTDGSQTITCDDGTSVTVTDGANGEDGGNVAVDNFHGADFIAAEHLEADGMYLVDAEITAATADADGKVTIDFTVQDESGADVPNIPSASVAIVKLVPPGTGEASNKWVPYLWRTQTTSGRATGGWPAADGTAAFQASQESNGTLTYLGDGAYRYVMAANLTTAKQGTTPITYERNLTHRVSVMLGGHSGPTGTASFDFVPDGTAVTATRNIVGTAVCKQCHGTEFAGHGGNRREVENCVTCHNPGSIDPQSGETIDMKVMIHKIHAGKDLWSVPGADGIVWDDPATSVDESADNGLVGTDGVRRVYTIWGYQNIPHSWEHEGFPANITNCVKCHDGDGEDVDNWKEKPSREACGSCHDTINFATGTGHLAQTTDANCLMCHNDTAAPSVTSAHGQDSRAERNQSEYTATLTVSAPANGQYFVDGEAPVISIVLKDAETGVAIEHTTFAEAPSKQGCWTVIPADLNSDCTNTKDGNFSVANLFVDGPRGDRKPVLTTNARAQVLSTNVGPWDLSAAGTSAAMVFTVDNGRSVTLFDSSGGDYVATGVITATLPASLKKAGVTAAEVVAWLNADTNFKRRAIAEVIPSGANAGKVSVRSRALGVTFTMKETTTDVPLQGIFGADTGVKAPTGNTVGNNLSARITSANNDPKAVRNSGNLQYTLDPVDDLAPGTYVASIEFADRGRIDDTNYVTPTVAVVTFQVGQADIELPPAGNCDDCHQNNDGTGMVFDPARHKKLLGDSAVDQCGACHDNLPQNPNSAGWTGAIAISRRTHAVHYGSELYYPNTTVAHSDAIPGRNWDIKFPRDVRDCQVCHPDGTTSGSWATEPARLPCGGCHDSDAATAHFRMTTYDPTPAEPWSGDEVESCATCHAP